MVNSAKQNAPWTDRTGNARRTIFGLNAFGNETIGDESVYYIGVCGSMPYSVSLEKGHGGKYAILEPTVRAYAPSLIEDIRNVISRSERPGVNGTARTGG